MINAGANDVVSLRGLTIEGGGVGNYGIVFNSGKSLFIDNCTVERFNRFHTFPEGTAILIQPTSGTMTFAIKNTTVSYNQTYGIAFSSIDGPTTAATILIDQVTVIGNGEGVNGAGIVMATAGSARVSIVSSTVSANTTGISVGTTVSASIDNVNITGNDTGIYAGGPAFVFLGRSTVENNASYGIYNTTYPNSFYTHQNNHINGNGTDIHGTPLAAPPQ